MICDHSKKCFATFLAPEDILTGKNVICWRKCIISLTSERRQRFTCPKEPCKISQRSGYQIDISLRVIQGLWTIPLPSTCSCSGSSLSEVSILRSKRGGSPEQLN